jgi:4-amino-4-deoxy-L-arabinose transferase-like glycosyltransferase
VMAKSVVGLFPLAALFVYSVAIKDFAFLKKRQFYYGLVLAAIIIIPWHIYQSWHYGQAFWDNYFLYHVWNRFTISLEYNGASFSFYWNILRQYLVFFGLLVISLVYFAVRSFRHRNFFYILVNALGLFLILSFARTKLPSYLVIVYPYLTIMIAVALAHIIALCRFAYLRYMAVAVLLSVFVFYGYSFNSYKLAKGESDLVLEGDKNIGRYLAANYLELPVYVSNPAALRNSIAFYANRPIHPLPDEATRPQPANLQQMKPLTRTNAVRLYLINNYLYIVK